MFSKIAATVFALMLSLSAVAAWANALQDFDQGVAADRALNIVEAATLFRKAADQGLPEAQYRLGVMYESGVGVTQDFKQSVFWYRNAADQGNAGAQFELGVMYERGDSVTQYFKQAVFWYRKAADQGYAAAQFNLGLKYYKGEGVTQDYVEAHRWLNIAAANGIPNASENRDLVAQEMTPAQITEAQNRASDWTAEFEKRKKQ